MHAFLDGAGWLSEDAHPLAHMVTHTTEGIYLAELVCGETVTTREGQAIPVRWLGEQHVQADMGRIPAIAEWCARIENRPWMYAGKQRLSREFPQGMRATQRT